MNTLTACRNVGAAAAGPFAATAGPGGPAARSTGRGSAAGGAGPAQRGRPPVSRRTAATGRRTGAAIQGRQVVSRARLDFKRLEPLGRLEQQRRIRRCPGPRRTRSPRAAGPPRALCNSFSGPDNPIPSHPRATSGRFRTRSLQVGPAPRPTCAPQARQSRIGGPRRRERLQETPHIGPARRGPGRDRPEDAPRPVATHYG